MPPVWLALPAFTIALPCGLVIGGRVRSLVATAGAGLLGLIALAAIVLARAPTDTNPDAFTARENASLMAVWLAMNAFGWAAGIAAGGVLRDGIDRARRTRRRRLEAE